MESNRQEKMFAIVEERIRTNSPITELCKKHTITKDSFGYWNEKYKRLHTISKSDFIPVKIAIPLPIKSGIKIIYPNQVEIIIEHLQDMNLVKQLINLI